MPQPDDPTGLRAAFSHVRAWVFDLDNTLYPPKARLFARMSPRNASLIQAALGVDEAEAHRLRGLCWEEHGTTLGGLMALHGVEPRACLDPVHDLSSLAPAPRVWPR